MQDRLTDRLVSGRVRLLLSLSHEKMRCRSCSMLFMRTRADVVQPCNASLTTIKPDEDMQADIFQGAEEKERCRRDRESQR